MSDIRKLDFGSQNSEANRDTENTLKFIADSVNSNQEIKDAIPNKADLYFDLFLEIANQISSEVYLKGNILLGKLLPKSARTTQDLDMSVVNMNVYTSIIVPILKQFGDSLVNANLAHTYEISEIAPKRSGGIKVRSDTNEILYSVDISLSENALAGVVGYTFGGEYVLGSSINKIIADKCLSTLSRKRFRRIKDFYDLYIILKSNMEFNVHEVISLMISKVGRDEVETLLNNYPFSLKILEECSKAWSKFTITLIDTGKVLQDKQPFNFIYSEISILYSILKDYFNSMS